MGLTQKEKLALASSKIDEVKGALKSVSERMELFELRVQEERTLMTRLERWKNRMTLNVLYIGVTIMAVSAFYDTLIAPRFLWRYAEGFGGGQVVGCVVGAIIFVYGFIESLRG